MEACGRKRDVELAPASTSHTRPLCIEQANHSPVSHARRLQPQPQDNAQTRRSTATFRYVRRERCYISLYPPPNTSHGFLHSVFACLSVLGIAHPNPCVVRRLSVALEISFDGIHSPHRYGGLLRSVSVLWRDRKLDDAHMPKEVTRKPYFRHSAGQSTSLLVSFGKRSRGNHTGSKRTTRHARARPPLRTPTLRYTSESRHLCQRTFEDSHTSHLPIPKPHRIAPNGFRLIVEWLNTQTTEYRHRL